MEKFPKGLKYFLILCLLLVLAGGLMTLYMIKDKSLHVVNQGPTSASDASLPGSAGLANPASVNCTNKGGQLTIKEQPSGGQYGICYFEDNRQCEEWALFRGDCPVGGLKITGYDNDEQIYCAITGGQVNMAKSTCTFKGKVCDLKTYFAGTCL